jgi:hypothetical protein
MEGKIWDVMTGHKKFHGLNIGSMANALWRGGDHNGHAALAACIADDPMFMEKVNKEVRKLQSEEAFLLKIRDMPHHLKMREMMKRRGRR